MSTSNHQPAISSTGDEQTPKVRKPYTISKQREKWTEEEHGKFLEALKLHGRAWRKIEEHIGTKTTVQIRSHAQKFFSKVIREASSSTSGDGKAMNPMDIPPPRPKRKPLHPYPRKSGSATNKLLPALKKLNKCSANHECSSYQENRSPTSVLSTIVAASDTIGESTSDVRAPDSYDVGSGIAAHLPDQKLNASASQQPCLVQVDAESSPTAEDKSDVEVGACTMANETPTTSLKLFGRTVVVSDAHKPSSCTTSLEQCDTSGWSRTHDEDAGADSADNEVKDAQVPPPSPFPAFPGEEGSWNPWSGAAPLMFYCQPSEAEQRIPAESSPHLWAFYSGLPPFPYLHSLNLASWCPGDELQKEEGSQSASNEAPVADTSGASMSPKLRNQLQEKATGFMPYKRNLVERVEQSNSSKSMDDEGR